MIILVHIERTGGSLINSAFMEHAPERMVQTFDGTLPDIREALARHPDRRFFVSGHFAFPEIEGIAEITPLDSVVSVVRDPVDRMMSLQALLRRSPDWFPGVAEHVNGRGLECFFDFCRERNFHTGNQQCRRICGSPDAEAAIRTIVDRFALVGSMGQFAKFGAALNGLVADWLPNFRLPVEVRGNAAPRSPEDEPDDAVKERILADSSEDARLVHYIEEQCGGVFIGPGAQG